MEEITKELDCRPVYELDEYIAETGTKTNIKIKGWDCLGLQDSREEPVKHFNFPDGIIVTSRASPYLSFFFSEVLRCKLYPKASRNVEMITCERL